MWSTWTTRMCTCPRPMPRRPRCPSPSRSTRILITRWMWPVKTTTWPRWALTVAQVGTKLRFNVALNSAPSNLQSRPNLRGLVLKLWYWNLNLHTHQHSEATPWKRCLASDYGCMNYRKMLLFSKIFSWKKSWSPCQFVNLCLHEVLQCGVFKK